jgi:hypothetical protein
MVKEVEMGPEKGGEGGYVGVGKERKDTEKV